MSFLAEIPFAISVFYVQPDNIDRNVMLFKSSVHSVQRNKSSIYVRFISLL